VSNDAARHELAEVLALAQEQMADLAVMQKKRAALTAEAAVADGTVEVTVNAQGIVTNTVVDESYLDEFDFADLGGYITQAAQAAAQEVGRRSAEMLTPLNERRKKFPSLSDIIDGAPDFREMMTDLTMKLPVDDVNGTNPEPPGEDDGWVDNAPYNPTVRG
jgi:DNA-binding protein YbaB